MSNAKGKKQIPKNFFIMSGGGQWEEDVEMWVSSGNTEQSKFV